MDVAVAVQHELVEAVAARHEVALRQRRGPPIGVVGLRADPHAVTIGPLFGAALRLHAARDQNVVAVVAVHPVEERIVAIADEDVTPPFAPEEVRALAAGEEVVASAALGRVGAVAVGAALIPVAPVAPGEPVAAGAADDFRQSGVTVRNRVAAVSALARMVDDLTGDLEFLSCAHAVLLIVSRYRSTFPVNHAALRNVNPCCTHTHHVPLLQIDSGFCKDFFSGVAQDSCPTATA